MADNPNELEISETLLSDKAALNEYWTEEALNEAIPIPVDLDRDAETAALLAEKEWSAEGELEMNAPLGPDGQVISGWDPQPNCPATGPNTEKVPNHSIIPYSPVGKLFMTFDGNNYVGSAWTIAGSGVFTAGHCVYDSNNGGWADNIMFVPQYHKGTSPKGRWAAAQIVSLKGWTEGGGDRFKYDLAAFKVDRPIQPTTGRLGWLANAPPNQGCVTGIGYPAGAPFDGKEMWRSTGKNLGDVNPIRAYNDMTGGCSGGPWEIWKDGVPLTNGVNSFRWRNGPQDEMYSPYFGQGFLNIWNWVK